MLLMQLCKPPQGTSVTLALLSQRAKELLLSGSRLALLTLTAGGLWSLLSVVLSSLFIPCNHASADKSKAEVSLYTKATAQQ